LQQVIQLIEISLVAQIDDGLKLRRCLCGREPEYPQKTHVVEQVMTWPSCIWHRVLNLDCIGEKWVHYLTSQLMYLST